MLKNHKFEKFIKHNIVGGIDTVLVIGTYFLSVYIGINYLISNIISHLIPFLISYNLHRIWVFKYESNNKITNFTLYSLITVIIVLFSEALLFACVGLFGFGEYISAIIILPFVSVFSYLLYKHYVFKK